MMMTMQSREYHLPEPVREKVRLQFFVDRNGFVQHVRDHFAHPAEGWDLVLGGSVIKMCRQIRSYAGVSSLEEAYDRIVQALDDGIEWSVEMPVFVDFLQNLSTGQKREGYCFVAKQGFYAIAYDDTVRTAIMVGDVPTDSAATRFRNAWQSVRRKFQQASYEDFKGNAKIVQQEAKWISQSNWETCPVLEMQT